MPALVLNPMKTQRIIGRAKLGTIGKMRRLLRKQKANMKGMLEIDIKEKYRVVWSEFDIEVTGQEAYVDYWCTATALQMNSM